MIKHTIWKKKPIIQYPNPFKPPGYVSKEHTKEQYDKWYNDHPFKKGQIVVYDFENPPRPSKNTHSWHIIIDVVPFEHLTWHTYQVYPPMFKMVSLGAYRGQSTGVHRYAQPWYRYDSANNMRELMAEEGVFLQDDHLQNYIAQITKECNERVCYPG